jgi:protein TonB
MSKPARLRPKSSLPVPTPLPIALPVPEKVPIAIAPELVAIPPPPSSSGPSQAPPKPSPKPTFIVHKTVTSTSKGAEQATPDEMHNEPPEYPEESQAAHEEGVVVLKVEVTAGGIPTQVIILKSSGYFRLDQAARKAVLHWKFTPAMTAGIPISSEADVPVRFKLQ